MLLGTSISSVAEIDAPGDQNRRNSTSVWCESSMTATASTSVIAVRQSIVRTSSVSDTISCGSTCGSQRVASAATRRNIAGWTTAGFAASAGPSRVIVVQRSSSCGISRSTSPARRSPGQAAPPSDEQPAEARERRRDERSVREHVSPPRVVERRQIVDQHRHAHRREQHDSASSSAFATWTHSLRERTCRNLRAMGNGTDELSVVWLMFLILCRSVGLLTPGPCSCGQSTP